MIAEETNTSIGAIYHHFSGKEEIAAQTLASLDEGYEEYFEYLMEDEAAQALTPLKKLEEYFVFVQIRSSETKSLNYAYIHDPVSYTHLDVYKRQLFHRPGWNRRPPCPTLRWR